METTALYTLATKYGVNALSVLTVSDHIFTGEETTSEERQTTFNEMIEIALDAQFNNNTLKNLSYVRRVLLCDFYK